MPAHTFGGNLEAKSSRRRSIRMPHRTAWSNDAHAVLWGWLAVILGLVFLVNGCMVGPDFIKPDAKMEEIWLQQQSPRIKNGPADFSAWWVAFNDPVLNNLIGIASRQNLDLQNAGLRILEARAVLGIAVGSQYPQTQQFSGGATTIGLSENAPNSAAADQSFHNYQLGFDAA